jgi:acetyl-CoA carboxylase biotin carboxyl carrier protein
MTEPETNLEKVELAATELIPQLTERLARHGLGEIEVRHGDLHVRVSGRPAEARPGVTAGAAEQPTITEAGPARHPAAEQPGSVTSPAVGYFFYADGLGPGLGVEKGDSLGYVEMLGVRHDVRAPRGGTVRNLVAESGEAVEYGQVVIELEASEAVLA